MIRTTNPSDEDSSHVGWTGQVMPTTNPKLDAAEPHLPIATDEDGYLSCNKPGLDLEAMLRWPLSSPMRIPAASSNDVRFGPVLASTAETVEGA